jgi:hypothetical protein
VRKERCATVEEQAAVDDDRAVIPIQREGCTRTEERELQAMVTDSFRYTS